ncbi:MAG: N-acetylglucosamine-6-phosphate deacetylase [Streptosporangiaceae bacterium]
MAETLIAAEHILPAAPPPRGSRAAAPPDDPGLTISPGYVLVRDGVIAEVGDGPPGRAPDLRLESGVLVPGFVDLQVNGYYGVELADVHPDEWQLVASRLPETGTTAFMPTFITAPVSRLIRALHATPPAATAAAGPRRARILGVHLEGPFISPLRAGAHNKDWMSDPSPDAIAELLDAGDGILKIVTLAPELPGALAAIGRLAQAGVLVSAGHSDARAGQVAEAAGAGARMVTHLFNAQRPLHHREPGLPGQALADARLTSGLIADGHHVAAQVCTIAFAAAPGRICLVTDAAACAGMPPGRYLLGGEPIELPAGDGSPPVRSDGTLAGSALRMDVAVTNMVRAGVGLPEAVAAATRIPADLIGRPELGRIARGAQADLTWLAEDPDGGLRACATWVAGQLAYRRGTGRDAEGAAGTAKQ